MAAPKFDNSTNILSNIAEVYGLDQLITEYTRITDKSSTLIDLIFTNTPDRVVCSGVSHIGISDHGLVYAFRKVSYTMPGLGMNFLFFFLSTPEQRTIFTVKKKTGHNLYLVKSWIPSSFV